MVSERGGRLKAAISLTSVLRYAMLNPQVRLAGDGRRVSGLFGSGSARRIRHVFEVFRSWGIFQKLESPKSNKIPDI